MKLDIISKDNEKKGSIELPKQYDEKLRTDKIKRAVESEQAGNRQKYGASPDAGLRHSTFLSKRRHNYKATYGIGQSRTPRKITSRSGSRMNFVGAFAPQTVGGRRAHPPKAEKIWDKKINNKEEKIAIRSSISATLSKALAKNRGHIIPDNYPFVIDESFEKISKTKDIVNVLNKAGLDKELTKAKIKKVRPGRGKSRGRKYKKKTSILIVTGDDCKLLTSAKNIPGVTAMKVTDLNVSVLAPGSVPGRATLWTKAAIDRMTKEKLYL